MICLVGPTVAGKSRFLADIECLAQRDTPTRRQILIDGKPPDLANRFSGESGLVVQISQNMNFVMDLPVEEFLHMHAESRSLPAPASVVKNVMESAIGMAGEPFGPRTQITQLSGGQSRALMIADAAFLSPKLIVLIDEIENAGVDRTSALKLFVEKGKIVLLSTHDLLLALSGGKRLVIRNGGVCDVIVPTPEELEVKSHLVSLDASMSDIRARLRAGETIALDWAGYFFALSHRPALGVRYGPPVAARNYFLKRNPLGVIWPTSRRPLGIGHFLNPQRGPSRKPWVARNALPRVPWENALTLKRLFLLTEATLSE